MPSEKVLEAKKAKVEKLTEILKNAVSFVIVDYKGITVEEDTKLRRELRESNVHYTVEKNSMLRFALKNAGIEGLDNVLEGTTAIAVSNDDQTAPARILGKFASETDGKFNLKAGMVEGQIYDEQGVVALSKIPSKDVLLAQLVGSLQGPIQKLAALLKAVADSKTRTLLVLDLRKLRKLLNQLLRLSRKAFPRQRLKNSRQSLRAPALLSKSSNLLHIFICLSPVCFGRRGIFNSI